MTTGNEVVTCARDWVRARVKWRHQGTTRNGCDCIGFMGGVAAELGISDAWVSAASASWKGYGRLPQAHLIYQGCAEFLDPVTPKESARPGDIMLLTFEKEPQHFAIYCERQLDGVPVPYMIHAYAQARRVTENIIDEMWRARWVCAYRFRGLES